MLIGGIGEGLFALIILFVLLLVTVRALGCMLLEVAVSRKGTNFYHFLHAVLGWM